ncbi:MAG TPA: hypothetical protein VMV92_17040 [Streptosporangiaceae bacterium]|nr:hypothetical protein [Streptosporangiaceae bacterium]
MSVLFGIPVDLAYHLVCWLAAAATAAGRTRRALQGGGHRHVRRVPADAAPGAVLQPDVPAVPGPLTEEDFRYLHETHGLPRELVTGLLSEPA